MLLAKNDYFSLHKLNPDTYVVKDDLTKVS